MAQILDYASTLAKWDYEKLDTTVRTFMEKRHGRETSIYDIVKIKVGNLECDEIEFSTKSAGLPD